MAGDMLVRTTDDNGIVKRWADMGDGTMAEVVATMDRLTVAGGASTFRAISAASTNAVVIKPTAAILYGIQMTNLAALGAARVVKLYNQNTVPTAASVPALTFVLPGNGFFDVTRSRGVAFPAGLAISISSSVLDGVLAAIGAGDVTVNLNFT